MINRMINLPKNKSFFLFGPRQTGKSTLLRNLYSNTSARFYDLLETDTYTRLAAAPELLRFEIQHRSKNIQYIILDEVQRIPALLNEVHWLLEHPNPPIVVLTGSSARALKRQDVNLLAGRALSYNLYPLTISELGTDFSLIKALQYGTLPSVYMDEENIAQESLRSYVDIYLREEIEREAQLRRVNTFVRFLSFAGAMNGEQVNFSGIAQQLGTTHTTVRTYFQILEDTLVGQLLQPYASSQRKRLARQPKFYFFDPGIVRALTKQLTVPLEPGLPAFGKAFEHFVLLEIFRLADYYRSDFRFSYYRTATGAEVDLIVETPSGSVMAVEIKSTDTVQPKQLTGLHSFQSIEPRAKLICISRDPFPRQFQQVTILPWSEIQQLFDASF